jgi:hypothetical protein
MTTSEVVALGFDSSCAFHGEADVPIAINELGQIAYAPELDDPFLGLVDTVFAGSSKIWDARDPAFASNLRVTDVALDDAGELAFRAANSLVQRVCTGSDPVSDKVLAIGDPLCGSTVIGVDFHRYGIDPLGRLALGVALADGRQLVVRAEEVLGDGGACLAREPGAVAAAWGAIASLLAVAGGVRGGTSRARRRPSEEPSAALR